MSTTVKPVSSPTPHGAVRTSATNRLGPRWLNWIRRLFGTPSQRRLAQGTLRIDAIRYWEGEFGRLSDADLTRTGQRLRGRARGGEALEQLLPEAFGLV